jgi:hypothetical protein
LDALNWLDRWPFLERVRCTGVPEYPSTFEFPSPCSLQGVNLIFHATLRTLWSSNYGTAADSVDENLEMLETVASHALKEFARLMVQKFGAQYLNRCPTPEEKERNLGIMKNRGWPGAFASWDCKHFEWENCPVRLAGQSKGHSDGGKKTLVLEAIADADLYIWYSFFC